MKALALDQPWASLIADGRNTVETRPWAPPRGMVGERFAIHAGAKVDLSPFGRWFEGQSIRLDAIICTARLRGFGLVKRSGSLWSTMAWWYGMEQLDRVEIDEFGDFSPGRYLWKLAEVEAVSPIVHIAGRQGLWDWVQ